MSLDLKDPLIQLKLASSICSTVAILSTSYRLWVRRGRLWFDDGFAFFSMLCVALQVGSVFMHLPPDEQTSMSRLTKIASYYIMALTFYAVIWTARLSILFSIIRIDPSTDRRRKLRFISLLFLASWMFLMAQLFWVCEPQHGWKDSVSPQCKLNKEVAICQLVTDILADSVLMAAPIKLLAGLDDKGLRRRLFVIFSTCVCTTIVSLVHAAYIIRSDKVKVVLSAIVEDCVSLIVCNLPVVVTATIRLRESSERERERRQGLPSTFIKFASRVRPGRSVNGGTTTTNGVGVGSNSMAMASSGDDGKDGSTTTKGWGRDTTMSIGGQLLTVDGTHDDGASDTTRDTTLHDSPSSADYKRSHLPISQIV